MSGGANYPKPSSTPPEHPLPDLTLASCNDHPTLAPDDWFGDPNSPPTSTAREVCLHECPVRGDCLRYVMGLSPQPPGIFAGLTEPERRRLAPRYRARQPRLPFDPRHKDNRR